MTKLTWDDAGKRTYETGVSNGVLYLQNSSGVYDNGVAWNGLTTVTESPSGADATPIYADNKKYLNLVAAEQLGGTIEAYTYPEEFEQCDGTASPSAGISIGQQSRKPFGFSFKTLVGNDIDGTDYGYKLHLIYGALAAPSEKAHATVNDTPEAMSFSWGFSTTPVEVAGFKPTSQITLDSTKVDKAKLAQLEELLYGTAGVDPELPMPADVIALFEGTVVEVRATAPTQVGDVVTIPTVTGVVYTINGKAVSGDVTLTEDVVVHAQPAQGYIFPAVSDDDWYFPFS